MQRCLLTRATWHWLSLVPMLLLSAGTTIARAEFIPGAFISGDGYVRTGAGVSQASGMPAVEDGDSGAILPNISSSISGTLTSGLLEMTPTAGLQSTYSPSFVGIIPSGGMSLIGSPDLDGNGAAGQNVSYLSWDSDIYWTYAGPRLDGFYYPSPLNAYTKVSLSVTLADGDNFQGVIGHNISRESGGFVYLYSRLMNATGPGTFTFTFDDTATYSAGGAATLRQTFGLSIYIVRSGAGESSVQVQSFAVGTHQVPEPSTLTLATCSALCVAICIRRRRRPGGAMPVRRCKKILGLAGLCFCLFLEGGSVHAGLWTGVSTTPSTYVSSQFPGGNSGGKNYPTPALAGEEPFVPLQLNRTAVNWSPEGEMRVARFRAGAAYNIEFVKASNVFADGTGVSMSGPLTGLSGTYAGSKLEILQDTTFKTGPDDPEFSDKKGLFAYGTSLRGSVADGGKVTVNYTREVRFGSVQVFYRTESHEITTPGAFVLDTRSLIQLDIDLPYPLHLNAPRPDNGTTRHYDRLTIVADGGSSGGTSFAYLTGQPLEETHDAAYTSPLSGIATQAKSGGVVDFGLQRIGTQSTRATLDVTNNNSADHVLDITLPAFSPYSFYGGGFTGDHAEIVGGTSATMSTTFAPRQHGDYTFSFTPPNGDGVVTLTGTGVGPVFETSLPPMPGSQEDWYNILDFGEVVQGTIAERTFTFRNSSTDENGGNRALTDLTIPRGGIGWPGGPGWDGEFFSVLGLETEHVLGQGDEVFVTVRLDARNAPLGLQHVGYGGMYDPGYQGDYDGYFSILFNAQVVVPEPSTSTLALIAAAGLVLVYRSHRRMSNGARATLA